MTLYRHRASGPGTAGDLWTTTMHTSGAQSLAATHTAWATFVNGWLSGGYGAMIPNDVTLTELATDQLDPVTGRNVAQTKTAVALAGTGAGATQSPRTALVVGLRTNLPTRAGRGRMFWPAPDASHMAATGLLIGADATSLANAFGTALTTFKATAAPVVWHQKTKTFDSVIYVTVGTILGTQKRRTNRVFNSYASKTI